MKAFADIKTLYSHREELNIDQTSNIYHDKIKLKAAITELLAGRLLPTKIIGKKVLLKPNWVLHDRKPQDHLCLRTNDSLVLAVLEVVLEMQPESVVLGDAPVQGCRWDKMLSTDFFNEVDKLSKYYQIEVKVKDFRRVVMNMQTNQLLRDQNSLDDFLIFDLGTNSYLEEICNDERTPFRVTQYDPSRLAESHRKGVHKYCVTKELFDADIVITIPKIKTHQKAGITNSLKILVGVNGDKDYLPHHRKGSVESGGDCYPGKHPLRTLSENILDFANKRIGTKNYKNLLRLSAFFWRASFPNGEQNTGAAWYGNDTTWRMVLDLNRVAIYGKADGTLSENPERELFTLCDGIIVGQGDGPLNPEPLALGVIAFSNNAALMDLAAGYLMGMKVEKIPLLRNASLQLADSICEFKIDGKKADIDDIRRIAVKAKMSPGWIGYDKVK